jgi:phosphatidate cytidylyltransferase
MIPPTAHRPGGSHLKRVVSGLVLIPPAVVAILWSSPVLFAAFVGLLALGAAGEFFGLAASSGLRPVWPVGMLAAALAATSPQVGGAGLGLAALALGGGGALAALALAGRDPATALARAGLTALGAGYVGGLLGFAVVLRQAPDGPRMVLAAALTTWAGDMAAFYVGRAWGRRPLAPALSPGKTVEGAAAGLLASTLVAAAGTLGLWPGSALPWALAGTLAGLAGQVGDVTESLVKRGLGAKDSGRVIPGHGGLLDRLDSLLFALPVLYGLHRLGLVP